MGNFYASRIGAISESPPSEDSEGASWRIRIFVGARTALVFGILWDSGIAEGARDGAADVTADPDLEEAFNLLKALRDAGAEMETEESFGSVTLPMDALSSVALGWELFDATNEACSESLSPTQVRASHRPPAIPLISRLASRQCLTFLPPLSRGKSGANPVTIFWGGWTGNGFVGRGYTGMGTFSRFGSSINGADTGCGELGGMFSGSGECCSNCRVTGDEAAVPV